MEFANLQIIKFQVIGRVSVSWQIRAHFSVSSGALHLGTLMVVHHIISSRGITLLVQHVRRNAQDTYQNGGTAILPGSGQLYPRTEDANQQNLQIDRSVFHHYLRSAGPSILVSNKVNDYIVGGGVRGGSCTKPK